MFSRRDMLKIMGVALTIDPRVVQKTQPEKQSNNIAPSDPDRFRVEVVDRNAGLVRCEMMWERKILMNEAHDISLWIESLPWYVYQCPVAFNYGPQGKNTICSFYIHKPDDTRFGDVDRTPTYIA